jgi:anti-sigma regulatory factor (Ser/Thr protein kinase)
VSLTSRVEHEFPVAVVALDGTLDLSTAIDAMLALRGCLASQPVGLVIDARGLAIADEAALRPLADLAVGVQRWPGSRLMLAGGDSPTREAFAHLAGTGAVDICASVDDAVASTRRLPVPPAASAALAPDARAPAACRELVARACHEWHLDRWQRLMQLLASELVTNAVTHARTPLSFTVRLFRGALQVAVRDGDPRLVDHPPGGPYRLPAGEAGRGLLLLEALADDWGCAPTGDGKVIWASVSLRAKVHHDGDRDDGNRQSRSAQDGIVQDGSVPGGAGVG